MTAIDVPCPQCGQVYHSERAHIGKHFRCSVCGSLVVVFDSASDIVVQQSQATASAKTQHPKRQSAAKSRIKPPSKYLFVAALTVAAALALLVLLTRSDRSNIANSHASSTPEPHTTQEQPATISTPDRPDLAIGQAEPIPKSPTHPKRYDARPKVYNSLPTGTRIEEDIGTGGHGELKVKNGTDEDSVVQLFDLLTNQVVRWFFVQANSEGMVGEIREGTYAVTFTTGLDWVEPEHKFKWHESYFEFQREFVYRETREPDGVRYSNVSVTLNPVLFGNLHAKSISREEFLRGHAYVILGRSPIEQ